MTESTADGLVPAGPRTQLHGMSRRRSSARRQSRVEDGLDGSGSGSEDVEDAEDDMADAGLTSGVRKVYDLVVGKKNGKCGKSKAKQAPAGTPGDSAIARMFAKKAKTETVAE